MRFLPRLAQTLGAVIICAVLSATSFGQIVTVIDFGADDQAAFGGVGANTAFTELIDPSDPAPIAAAFPNAGTGVSSGTIGLNGGASIAWTDVTAWNNSDSTGTAGDNYFANVAGNAPTTFAITTANATDSVLVEAIGGGAGGNTPGRDALVDYGGSLAVNPGSYTIGTPWTVIGTSVGSSSGSLAVGTAADEGNIGAFRITITPESTVVPEPSSLVLLGLAGLSLAARRRRS